MSTLSVAVIGAGAAGLCAARHLLAAKLRVSLFEQADCVGGTWVYTDTTSQEAAGPIHSSMYRNLHTNLPKEVMAFPDFPFPASSESFVHHSVVRSYLELYCQHFGLSSCLQLGTAVQRVRPAEGGRWEVVVRGTQPGCSDQTQLYDGVMVCNGHYSVPARPAIPGLEQFGGRVEHSHDYRGPEQYTGQAVVVLGAAASGTDISMELATAATTVYLSSYNPPLASVLPPNVQQVAGVERCPGPGRLLLTDGREVEAAALLLATGYQYTFPFLDPECGVTVRGRRVAPLYKHLVNITHPTMCFIGIPIQICPFPQFDLQARYFTRLLTGEAEMPSRAAMEEDTEREERWRAERGLAGKHFHKMGELQWDYNRELAALAGLPAPGQAVERLYTAVSARRRAALPHYKRDSYQLQGEAFTGRVFDHQTETFQEVVCTAEADPTVGPFII